MNLSHQYFSRYNLWRGHNLTDRKNEIALELIFEKINAIGFNVGHYLHKTLLLISNVEYITAVSNNQYPLAGFHLNKVNTQNRAAFSYIQKGETDRRLCDIHV